MAIRETLNCPNCGAPIDGVKCQYCGTVIYDFANFAIGKESYLRMDLGGKLVVLKAIGTSAEFHMESDRVRFWRDDNPIAVMTVPHYSFDLSFEVVSDAGVLLTEYLKEGANGRAQ